MSQHYRVKAMVWCHQATSHYLSQCWPKCVSPSLCPNGLTVPLQGWNDVVGPVWARQDQMALPWTWTTSQRPPTHRIQHQCGRRLQQHCLLHLHGSTGGSYINGLVHDCGISYTIVDGLVQNWSNSSALALMELLQSRTNPSIWHH